MGRGGNLTADKVCEMVAKLGYQFEFNPEQIEEITGLKILGIKNNSFPAFEEGEPKKMTKTPSGNSN